MCILCVAHEVVWVLSKLGGGWVAQGVGMLCPLVQVAGKPAFRAPSVQGTVRPSIWMGSELSSLFCRDPC